MGALLKRSAVFFNSYSPQRRTLLLRAHAKKQAPSLWGEADAAWRHATTRAGVRECPGCPDGVAGNTTRCPRRGSGEDYFRAQAVWRAGALRRWASSSMRAAGVMPSMRPAWASVAGRRASSFWRTSDERLATSA